MSLSGSERQVIQTNSDAFTQSLGNDFFNLIGSTENQANKIFKNLDAYQANDPNDYKEAIKEYRNVFDQYNKNSTANGLPTLRLVDADNDGDMDIQVMNGKKVNRTFVHK